MNKPRVVICINTSWNLVNFRGGLVRALIEAGYEVVALAPVDAHAAKLMAMGVRHVHLPMDAQGTHPLKDMWLMLRIWWVLRREKPLAFLGYTIKPNVYGSLAAHRLGVPVINNISGLGAVFIKDGWMARLVRVMYRLALKHSLRVFFQNGDDRRLFIESGLVKPEATDLLPGSGVDLKHFAPVGLPQSPAFRFLLIARMLWDKGVGEYIEAARVLRQQFPAAEFCLLGFVDVPNPAAIPRWQVEAWAGEPGIHYLGTTEDVRPYIAESHCVVLPSYREGTPRTLLEAAAMGRPLIATDAVGCREVVEHGGNGYLCEIRNAEDLAAQMRAMLTLSVDRLVAMSERSRAKVVCEFDERMVIGKYLQVVRACAERSWSR